jgi:uncharacterized protein (TIGR03435 family)
MLQTLLAERFKMRSHRVTAQAEGYGITVAKGGLKMKDSPAGTEPDTRPAASYVATTPPSTGVSEVIGSRATLKQLAAELSRTSGKPFWDQTGLTGIYDFSFRYSQEVSAGEPTGAPFLATALRQDLGLALQKQQGPVETLVVDSIQPPSEN